MYKFLIGALLAPAMFTSALAADISETPYEGEIVGATWGGWYLGVDLGWAQGESRWYSPTGNTGNFDIDGALAGVTIGHNFQSDTPWVVGLEFNGSFGDLQALAESP